MRAHRLAQKPPRPCGKDEWNDGKSDRPPWLSCQRLSLLERPDAGGAGDALPLHPAGALRKGCPGAQPTGKLCGHPAAALGPAAGLSALGGRAGRDPLPPVRRGGVHPVGLLRHGLGEHRPVHRRRRGHRSLLHQRGHLPQADAAERACALLRLSDDGGALFRQHVDHAAGAVHERRPQACHFSHR